MLNSKYYIGKVIDNNSPDQNGSVKVLVYDVNDENEDENLLDWAKPAIELQNIPEINDLVYIRYIDNVHYRKPYYGVKVNFKNLHLFNSFEKDIKSKIEGFSGAYPNVKFWTLKNGVTLALNSNEKEIALYNQEGSYIFLDKDGKIHVTGKATVEVKDDNGNITTLDSNGIKISQSDDTNFMQLDASGIILSQGNGTQEIKMDASGITLKTGDAVSWKANCFSNCIFSGAPHFTSVKLKGM